jgi:hypothetical protein
VGINEVAPRGPALTSHGRDGASPCGLYSTRPTRQRHHILGHEPWGSGSRLRRMEDAEPSEQELGMHVETQDPVNIFHSMDIVHNQTIRYSGKFFLREENEAGHLISLASIVRVQKPQRERRVVQHCRRVMVDAACLQVARDWRRRERFRGNHANKAHGVEESVVVVAVVAVSRIHDRDSEQIERDRRVHHAPHAQRDLGRHARLLLHVLDGPAWLTGLG